MCDGAKLIVSDRKELMHNCYLQGRILSPEIKKFMKLCEYVGDFLLITTQFFIIVQIHSKGVELTPENPVIFQFCIITREL